MNMTGFSQVGDIKNNKYSLKTNITAQASGDIFFNITALKDGDEPGGQDKLTSFQAFPLMCLLVSHPS